MSLRNATAAGKPANSLGVKLQRRFSQGLTYLFGYTWSRSIDTASAIRAHGDEIAFPQDSTCLRCERGLSSFHTAQRVVVSTFYEFPFGRGRKYFQAGGWQIGSILTLQTGFPIAVRTGSNTSTGLFTDRPNATGARVALPRGQQGPERFFNPAAFVRPPFGTFGNVGRNTVIGPGIIAWDFSTLKNVRVREGQQLQFRFEAFNLPNHPNWGSPGNILILEDFGKIRSTRTPMRELQFGLKYIF